VSTLWAITSGSYSDYTVNAVFDTEEDARAAIALKLGEDLTELDYYRSGDKPIQRGVWHANSGPISADGPVPFGGWSLEAHLITSWVPSSRPERPSVREIREGQRIWVYVEAPTKELAEKVLHDRIAKARAELLGL